MTQMSPKFSQILCLDTASVNTSLSQLPTVSSAIKEWFIFPCNLAIKSDSHNPTQDSNQIKDAASAEFRKRRFFA